MTSGGMHPGDGGRFGELREQHHSPPFLPSPGPQPRNTPEAGEYTVENETSYLLLQAASSRAAVAGWGPWMQEELVLLEQTQLHALTSVLCIPGAVMGGKGRHCLPGARLGRETFSLLSPATCPGCSACHNVPIHHTAVPHTSREAQLSQPSSRAGRSNIFFFFTQLPSQWYCQRWGLMTRTSLPCAADYHRAGGGAPAGSSTGCQRGSAEAWPGSDTGVPGPGGPTLLPHAGQQVRESPFLLGHSEDEP